MKKFLNTLLVLLILPVLILSGCKNSSLPAINLSRYLKDEISVKRNDLESSKDSLSLLTQKKAKKSNLSKYESFELTTQAVWTYKMYIESITFYVYCNESSDYQMTLNVSMSNLASEDTINSTTSETIETETVSEPITFTPKSKKAIKCTANINKTVANALGSTITIKLDSLEIFSGDEENPSTFMWLIYGLEIHGESRTYNR